MNALFTPTALPAPPTPESAQTCSEFVRAVAAAYGDHPAVALGEQMITYRELDQRSAALAEGLLRRGVAKGSRIGILLSNSPSWVLAWTAVTRIGCVAAALSTFLKPPELARVVRHGDLHGVIAQPGFLGQDFPANFEQAFPGLAASSPELSLPDAPYLRWVVVTGDDTPAWARPWSWLDAEGDDDHLAQLREVAESEVHPDEPAIVIYTSGQSAAPKAVVHSHRNVIDKTHYLRTGFDPSPGAVATTSLPFFWVGGLALQLLIVLEVGGLVRCSDGATSGGPVQGSVNRPVSYHASGRVAGLGMSETFAVYGWGTEAPHPEHPLCTPMTIFDPEVDVKVVRSDGALAGEGETGEILVRGRGITLGLHKVARADAFDEDGYYRTGDQALLHDGALCFLGRLDDMIKTAGANVSPAEVERELVGLPGVAFAHVVAVDVPGRGHLVGAAVVPEPGVTLDAREVAGELRSRLSTYKVPRRIAFFADDEIPKTPSLKLDKRRLAELIGDRADGEAR